MTLGYLKKPQNNKIERNKKPKNNNQKKKSVLKIEIGNAGPPQINFCRFHLTSTILLSNKAKKFQSQDTSIYKKF